jgi:hypothetical protein
LSGWNFAGQDLRRATFESAQLAGADFSGADLREARIYPADLVGANFTGADIRGAWFESYRDNTGKFVGGITLEQLYSTASYQAGDLSGVSLPPDSNGANYAGMNLTNLSLNYISLSGANLNGADLRGSDRDCFCLPLTYGLESTNIIHADGHIDGVQLGAGQILSVRDYDGHPYTAFSPRAITVGWQFMAAPEGALRMIFDADGWDSTISFAPDIPVTLGGKLELIFDDGVDLASQVGRTFDLFNWTSVNPTGAFSVSSRYAWDLSNLYTTGEVTLIAVPEPVTISMLILGTAVANLKRRAGFGKITRTRNSAWPPTLILVPRCRQYEIFTK